MMVFSHIVMMCIYVTRALRIHKGLKLKVYLYSGIARLAV